MNYLNINFKNNIANIIDAFTSIYGEDYRNIITTRVKNINYVMYNNVDGIKYYYNFLLECKEKELTLLFLNKIGINLKKFNIRSYADKLDPQINKFIQDFFGNRNIFTCKTNKITSGLLVFKDNYNKNNSLQAKLDFINYLRGNDKSPITSKNITDSKNTTEYKKTMILINNYLNIYYEFEKEFNRYVNSLKDYQSFIVKEDERYEKISSNKKVELYKIVKDNLPVSLRNLLDNYSESDEVKAQKLFGSTTKIDEYFAIEAFSSDNEQKLNDDNTSDEEKEKIYDLRKQYFSYFKAETNIDVKDFSYKELIEYNKINGIIPSSNFVSLLKIIKEQVKDEAKRLFILTNDSYINNYNNFDDVMTNKERLYQIFKSNKICMTSGLDENNEFQHILCFTARKNTGGILDFIFLHEINHVIEMNTFNGKNYISGFDITANNAELNSYNCKKRKYERLNETINDIFAMEARKVLLKKGIYLVDDEKHIINNVENMNTSNVLKLIIMPFLNIYRNQIIKARIIGNMDEFTNIIGKNNFEELNDAFNYIDNILETTPLLKILSNKNIDSNNEELIKEYNYQLIKIKNIYSKMNYINTEKPRKR